MIQALNDRQRDQGLKLQQIQETMEAQKEREKKREDTVQEILKRIDVLEENRAQSRTWRQPHLDDDEGDGH